MRPTAPKGNDHVEPQNRNDGRGTRSPHPRSARTCAGSQSAAPEGRTGRAAVRASPRTGDQADTEDHRIPDGDRREGDHHRRAGHEISGDDLQRVDARADDGGASGRLCRADAGQSRNQHDAAQYRLPFGNRRARRRRAHADQSRRAGGVALEGRSYRHVRLSLRAGRLDDPVARRVRHARHRDGVAARRAEGRQRQGAALRPDLLHRRA